MSHQIRRGNYEKMGVSLVPQGVIFTFAGVEQGGAAILLYDEKGKKQERIVIPETYRIGTIYSCLVEKLSGKNLRYNLEIGGRVLQDPYATRLYGREIWADESRLKKKHLVCCGIESDPDVLKDDVRPFLSDAETVIYKIHVREFTMQGLSRGKKKGTFAGVMDAIPYLQELGVTAVEFMPIYEFEEFQQEEMASTYLSYGEEEKKDMPVKLNCWGYKAGDYFAPKASFAYGLDPALEIKKLVAALHKAGMEAYLEFYFTEKVTGTFSIEVLRHWIKEYHIDGVHLLGEHLPINQIIEDPMLSDTKIFYTGFADAYISGNKAKNRLFVYNDEYLYPTRKMLNRMDMNMNELVGQITKEHPGQGYVNYITSNNGFTMADLFSYSEKHNEANGEEGRDGNNWNYSANYGAEGPSRKKTILKDRQRQMRNAFALLFLSKGVPLLYEGDEVCNTKLGNNNSYCQDNEIGYVNWSKNSSKKEMQDFVKKLLKFRKEHPVVADRNSVNYSRVDSGLPEVSFHGENAWITGIDYGRCAVGIMYAEDYVLPKKKNHLVYITYNFHLIPHKIALPNMPGKGTWKKVMDTSRDKDPFGKTEIVEGNECTVAGRSICIFLGEPIKEKVQEVKNESNQTSENHM